MDIIAPCGLDLAMAGYAGSKTVLSASFLRSEGELHRARAAFEATEFESEPEESDAEELPVDLPAPKKSQVAGRKRKGAATHTAGTQDVGSNMPVAPLAKNKRTKRPPVATSASSEAASSCASSPVGGYTLTVAPSSDPNVSISPPPVATLTSRRTFLTYWVVLRLWTSGKPATALRFKPLGLHPPRRMRRVLSRAYQEAPCVSLHRSPPLSPSWGHPISEHNQMDTLRP